MLDFILTLTRLLNLTRLNEYSEQREKRIAKAVEERVAEAVRRVGKEAYQKGYEDAKAESRLEESAGAAKL